MIMNKGGNASIRPFNRGSAFFLYFNTFLEGKIYGAIICKGNDIKASSYALIGWGNRNWNLLEFGVSHSNDGFNRNNHCVSDRSIFGDAGHDVLGRTVGPRAQYEFIPQLRFKIYPSRSRLCGGMAILADVDSGIGFTIHHLGDFIATLVPWHSRMDLVHLLYRHYFTVKHY